MELLLDFLGFALTVVVGVLAVGWLVCACQRVPARGDRGDRGDDETKEGGAL